MTFVLITTRCQAVKPFQMPILSGQGTLPQKHFASHARLRLSAISFVTAYGTAVEARRFDRGLRMGRICDNLPDRVIRHLIKPSLERWWQRSSTCILTRRDSAHPRSLGS